MAVLGYCFLLVAAFASVLTPSFAQDIVPDDLESLVRSVFLRCSNDSCDHGTCKEVGQSYNCTCYPGYTGVKCEQDIDECSPSPCKFGECFNTENRYTCMCMGGYTGRNCDQALPVIDKNVPQPPTSNEEEKDSCSPNPCVLGECSVEGGQPSCVCQDGYTGTHCDQELPKRHPIPQRLPVETPHPRPVLPPPSHSPTRHLEHTSNEKGCEGVGIVDIKRRVTFHQCEDICSSHGATFYAPTSYQSGACINNVKGAERPFWINTIQVLPHWGETTQSRLLNRMINQYVPNYAPTVHRNKPNGVDLDEGLTRGQGENCLYSLEGQYYGTKCKHGAQTSQCACQVSVQRQEFACSRVHVLTIPPDTPSIPSSECASLCNAHRLRFYGPASSHEITCFQQTTTYPTWIDLVQIFPVPGSNAFSFVQNIMTRKVQSSFSDRSHESSVFDVEVASRHGNKRGVSQNCIFYANSQHLTDKVLHGTDCEAGQRLRSCACVEPDEQHHPLYSTHGNEPLHR